MQHAFGVGQILENDVGSAGVQIGYGKVSSGDRNGSGLDAVAASNVGRGITDNDDRLSPGLPLEVARGPAGGNGWQVGPMCRVRAIGSDLKSARIDTRGAELQLGALQKSPGKKPKHDTLLRLESVE